MDYESEINRAAKGSVGLLSEVFIFCCGKLSKPALLDVAILKII